MRRDLPTRPSLDHLKKQAKDLLDGHQRGDEEALSRIRDAVPAFARMSDEELARAPFALHDAQSAIAREYGHKSWNELREAVAERIAAEPPSEEMMKALLNLPFPETVSAALKEAWSRRPEAAAVARGPVPRRAAAHRHAQRALHAGDVRTHSRGARRARWPRPLRRSLADPPRWRSSRSARRRPTTWTPRRSIPWAARRSSTPRSPTASGPGWSWKACDGSGSTPSGARSPPPRRGRGYQVAHVRAVPVDRGDAAEVAALASALLTCARPLASALPGGPRLVAMLEALEAEPLADLVIGNLPVSVAEKARYASEPRLAERLRIATRLTQALAASGGAPR